MGIFGSKTRQFLEYEIHLTDAQQVADLQKADAGDTLLLLNVTKAQLPFTVAQIQAPLSAAAEFNAPLHDPEDRLAGVPAALKITGPFTPPCCTSDWFTSSANYPLDQDGFRACSGGWFGICGLFGNKVYYYWRRKFVYTGSLAGDVPSGFGDVAPLPPTAIAVRRWVDGFELPTSGGVAGEGGTLLQPEAYSRDASRHTGGLGLAFREAPGTNEAKYHTTDEFVAGPHTASWERFYVRPRALPTTASCFWKCKSTLSPVQGMMLQLDGLGNIIVNSVNAAGAVTAHGNAGAMVLNEWTRIDLLLRYGPGAGGPTVLPYCKVYVNGFLQMNLSGPGCAGLESSSGGTHAGSGIGRVDNIGAVGGLEFDADDWMCADLPSGSNVTSMGVPAASITGADWFVGSRMQLVRVDGVVAQGTWSGGAPGWRIQLQNPVVAAPLTQDSSVSTDLIRFATDAARSVDALNGQQGVAAFVIACWNIAVGAANGRLGFAVPPAAPVLTAVNNPSGGLFGWSTVLASHLIPGTITPPPLGGLEIHVEHSASVQAEGLGGTCVVAEVLGLWGPEDPRPTVTTDVPPLVYNRGRGIHNAPYPSTPWARSGIAPAAPVAIIGGTYVGDGVPHDLAFPFPVNWLFVRPLTGTRNGVHWWSSMLAPHNRIDEAPRADLLPHALMDPSFAPAAAADAQESQALVRFLVDAQDNGAGVTYQYIAVCDPGMRFMLNGAFAHAGAATVKTNPLFNDAWLPQAAMFWQEIVPGGTTSRFWYKGLGHASTAGSRMTTAESPDVGDFAPGLFQSRPDLHLTAASVAANFWRRDDSSGDPGVPRVLQLVSYVGNGVNPRTIPLTPASGRRPLYGLVVPHDASGAIHRDPSHTTTTSTHVDSTADAATGIVGGDIDAILVHSALNAVGVTYDVFVLPGSVDACNAGWSCNGVFIPVDPSWPGDGPGDPPDWPPFEGPNPFEPTGPGGDIPTDLGGDLDGACAVWTHRVVNVALSRIGVTTAVSDLATELTQEAVLARLHYTEDVLAVLRDFPWAFATRYATLPLVRGPWWSAALLTPWSAAARYVPGDLVSYGGVVYAAVLEAVNRLPLLTVYWTPTLPTTDANGDWRYAYRVPADCVFGRRLVRPGMQRAFDRDPPPFRMGGDANGELLFTNERDPLLEYTTRPSCAAGAGDALFRDALGWRHAHSLAMPLAKDSKKQAYAWQMYAMTLTRATVPNANEQQPQRNDGDADWIAGRN